MFLIEGKCYKKGRHSKTQLSIKHGKKKTKGADPKKMEQEISALERRSFHKVVRIIERVDHESRDVDGVGAGGMTRNEMEKHFADQQESYESLERKMAHLQTLIENISTRRSLSGEGKSVEKKSPLHNVDIKLERKSMKRKSSRATFA